MVVLILLGGCLIWHFGFLCVVGGAWRMVAEVLPPYPFYIQQYKSCLFL